MFSQRQVNARKKELAVSDDDVGEVRGGAGQRVGQGHLGLARALGELQVERLDELPGQRTNDDLL